MSRAEQVKGVLADFLPHIQEVAGASIDWQVEKIVAVVSDLVDREGFTLQHAIHIAVEVVTRGANVPAPQAMPFGTPAAGPHYLAGEPGEEGR